jgi:hypothetical protein
MLFFPFTSTLLAIFAFSSVALAGRDCWVGSSSNTSMYYPPTDTLCDVSTLVCQLGKTKPDGVYSLLCADATACQLELTNLNANPDASIYTELICCDTELCNAYPGQPNVSSGNANSVPMILVLSAALVGFADHFWKPAPEYVAKNGIYVQNE